MDTPCSIVEEYNTYTPLHVVQYLQIVFSFLSIIVVIYTALRYLIPSIFERVFKGILVTVRLTSTDSCQDQISKFLCYSLRITSSMPISAFIWIHLAITVQRFISTVTGDERKQLLAGRIMIIFSTGCPCVLTYFIYRNETCDGRVPYCTGATAGSAHLSMVNLLSLFALDVLNLVLDFALLKYNQYKLKFDKSFHMLVTFRRRQNVYSIQQFLPSAIFHCVCYMVQVFMMLYGRTFRGKVTDIEFNTINAYTYLMPYYCSIGPIILRILMKKGRLIRKENLKNVVVPMNKEANDIHFSSLQQAWGVAEIRPARTTTDAAAVGNKNSV